jgi:hypothetical protein
LPEGSGGKVVCSAQPEKKKTVIITIIAEVMRVIEISS